MKTIIISLISLALANGAQAEWFDQHSGSSFHLSDPNQNLFAPQGSFFGGQFQGQFDQQPFQSQNGWNEVPEYGGGRATDFSGSQNHSGLAPANTNGNPGFGWSVALPDGTRAQCQGTLLPVVEGTCFVATAAHCGESSLNMGQGGYYDTNLESYVVDASVTMPDFGENIAVKFFLNPRGVKVSGLDRTEDSMVFAFPCAGAGEVQEIPLASTCTSENQELAYGKVMNGKAGLYEGIVWREPGVVAINNRVPGEATESMAQFGPVIEQGDSGGPMLIKVDGQYELAGVLSTGDDLTKNRNIGSYATCQSMEFIDRIYNTPSNELGI